MDDLFGKRALVCGSTQGIGRACAMELARRGADVTLAARDREALEKVRAELPNGGKQTHQTICVDFQDPSALRTEVERNVRASGAFHVLVNNTGGPHSGPILESAPQEFLAAFSNHIICNQLLAQAVLPGMKEAKFGRIVNIISTSVILPIRGLGVSNTIRAAVANWARTVAVEVAPFGITVNNVLPGYTDTARLKSLTQSKAKREGVSEDKVVRDWVASIPVGRLASADEIAAVVGFLASPAASYVTGVNLPVDGGRLAAQ